MSTQAPPRTGHEAVQRMESLFSQNGYKRSQTGNVILFTCDASPAAFQMNLLYNGDHGFELTHPDFHPSSWNCARCFEGEFELMASQKFFDDMEAMIKHAKPIDPR